jgi:hypothetical protein
MNKTNGVSWDNSSSFSLLEYGINPHGWSNISFYAYNNTGNTINLIPATLNSRLGNNVPILTSIGNKYVVVNSTLSFTLSATDADGDAILYDTDATNGTTFNPNTGEYTWITTPADVGTFVWSFNATDNQTSPGIDSETITVTVSFNNPPISVTSTFEAAQNTLYSVFSNTVIVFSLAIMVLGFGIVLYGFNRQKAPMIALGISTAVIGFAMLLLGNYIITAIVNALHF